MTLSSPTRPYLSTLFGSTVDADCVIRFTLAPDARTPETKKPRKNATPCAPFKRHLFRLPNATAEQGTPTQKETVQTPAEPAWPSSSCPVQAQASPEAKHEGHEGDEDEEDSDVVLFIGDPIPAHRLVLRCGSERFRAYMERWEQPIELSLLAPPCTGCSDQVLSPKDSPNQSPGVPQAPAAVTTCEDASLDNLQRQEDDSRLKNRDNAGRGDEARGAAGAGTCGISSSSTGAAREVKLEPNGSNGTAAATAATAQEGTAAAATDGAVVVTPVAAAAAAAPVLGGKRKRDSSPAACGRGRCSGGYLRGGSGGSTREILIPLESEDDLPAAKRALRFMYGAKVPYSIGFKDILNTRRLGAYLQIERCSEGCDEAMITKLEEEGKEDSAVVLDAYACWRAFPDDPTFKTVLAACQRHLVRHFPDALDILNSSHCSASCLYRQFLELPPPGIEALLASDDFGTDSESSVLVLLHYWLAANPLRPSLRRRLSGLVRVIHLSQAYLSYVLPQLEWFDADQAQRSMLAALATASSSERLLLRASASTVDLDIGSQGEGLSCGEAAGGGDGAAAGADAKRNKWQAAPRRQCVSGLRAFEWRMPEEELEKLINEVSARPAPGSSSSPSIDSKWQEVTFRPTPNEPKGARCAAAAAASGAAAAAAATDVQHIFAYGLRWKLRVRVSRTELPSLQLSCRVPLHEPLHVAGLQSMRQCPAAVSMMLLRGGGPGDGADADEAQGRGGGVRTRAVRVGTLYDNVIAFFVGCRMEIPMTTSQKASFLIAAERGAADLLAPWRRFLVAQDGEGRALRGQLVFVEPPPQSRVEVFRWPPRLMRSFLREDGEEEEDDDENELRVGEEEDD